MAGDKTEQAKEELSIITIVLCCLLSYYLRVVRWVFSRGKRRKDRSPQVPQTGPIPLSLVTAECNFDSCYQDRAAQT